jgi:hypothetical protein
MVVAMVGCGSGDDDLGEGSLPSDDTAPPTASAEASPGTDPTADGPMVFGHVLTADGRPVANAEVSVVGTLDDDGQYVAYKPRTGADGSYQAKVLPGEFSVSGLYTTEYLGKRYAFGLAPETGTGDETFPIRDAPLEVNFVWQISGRRPGTEGAGDDGTAFFGGQAYFRIADVHGLHMQDTHFADEFGNGFEAKVELIPEGPLIDGSTGTTYTSTHTVDMPNAAEWVDVDIPIGQYRVAVTVVRADGSTKALDVIGVAPEASGLDQRQPAPVFLTFDPEVQVSGGLRAMQVVLAYGPPYDPLNY